MLIHFEAPAPVSEATFYKEPSDVRDIEAVAIDSGPDFAFLVRAAEDSGWALFGDHAPRGFDPYGTDEQK